MMSSDRGGDVVGGGSGNCGSGGDGDEGNKDRGGCSNNTGMAGDDLNLSGLHLLESMFYYSRLSLAPSGSARFFFSRLLLVLYFPLGLLLVPLRLLCMVFAGIVATLQCSSFCLPRKLHTILLRMELLIFFGVWISVKGRPAADSPLWVANHISEFDALVLRAIADPYILGYHFYRDMWWLKLSPLRLFKMIYVSQQSRSEGNAAGRDEMNRLISSTLAQHPPQVLLLFPEGGLTNGRVGLLQYHKFVFGLGLPVQPIALSRWSPLPVRVDTMYASFLHNVLCFLFVPFQRYSVHFLQPLAPLFLSLEGGEQEQEASLAFSRRVMALTAEHLNIQASPFLYSDKKKWGALRRTLTKEGYRFNIVVDELKNSVSVVNTAPSKKKSRSKTSRRIQPVVTSSSGGEEGEGEGEVVSAGVVSDRDVLLSRLYDAWQMTQEGFSHLLFAPAVAPAAGTVTPHT